MQCQLEDKKALRGALNIAPSMVTILLPAFVDFGYLLNIPTITKQKNLLLFLWLTLSSRI